VKFPDGAARRPGTSRSAGGSKFKRPRRIFESVEQKTEHGEKSRTMAGTLTSIGLLPNSSTSPLASSLAVSGLASGMNWQNIVQELANAERAPETLWKQQQTTLNTQNTAFTTIKNDLTTLQTDLKTLQDPSLYSSRTASSSNPSVATASADPGANVGSYSFDILQLATAAKILGTGGVNAPLSADGNLSNVTIGTANFATPVTAGTFTINGKQITIATTDSLQQVFDNIASATGGEVTASYNTGTDEITLTDNNGNELILGSAADTSNFLQVARLYNNGGSVVTSTSALGSVRLTAAMSDADLKTAITDGGSGQGAFTINGVTINYNASTDSIQDVLDRINSSGAGVTASFDVQNNRFVLTNNSTGDVGISVQDVTGNFLTATGLAAGTLVRGQNLLYTLNGGSQQLTSLSNTISADSSGITGLSVTAAQTGQVTVTVASDTGKISSAIQQFINDYNAVQSYISSQTIVSTGSDGTVTPGTLTGDLTTNGIVSSLRALLFSPVSGNPLTNLANLGVQSNGQNNTVTLDTSQLAQVLQNNLNAVQSLFTDPANGLAAQWNNYLNATIGDNGTVTLHQSDLTSQSNDLTTQINNLEAKINSDIQQWTSEFQAMEQAQAQVNQELTYLSEQVSNGSL
jgi:flagellar hook-associated protein 2